MFNANPMFSPHQTFVVMISFDFFKRKHCARNFLNILFEVRDVGHHAYLIYIYCVLVHAASVGRVTESTFLHLAVV